MRAGLEGRRGGGRVCPAEGGGEARGHRAAHTRSEACKRAGTSLQSGSKGRDGGLR